MENHFAILAFLLFISVLSFWCYMVYHLVNDKYKKIMLLYDEIYTYFKNINKG